MLPKGLTYLVEALLFSSYTEYANFLFRKSLMKVVGGSDGAILLTRVGLGRRVGRVGVGGFGAGKTNPRVYGAGDPWDFAHTIPGPCNAYTVARSTLDPGPSMVGDKSPVVSFDGAVAFWTM